MNLRGKNIIEVDSDANIKQEIGAELKKAFASAKVLMKGGRPV